MKIKKIYPYIFIICLSLLSACAPRVYAPVYTSTTQATPDGFYRVQKGDNLYRIGLRYGLSVEAMTQLNQLNNAHQIEVGQLLRIRPSGSLKKNVKKPTATQKHTKKTQTTKIHTTSADLKKLHLIWPNSGKISAHFNGTTRKGIDISSRAGSPVVAAAAGTVAYVGNKVRGYGNLILIRHSKNVLTAYAHSQQILVKKGQQVRQGQKIATVGNSNTGKSQLHFELRLNGKAVNPLPYLPAR